jgi:putative protease
MLPFMIRTQAGEQEVRTSMEVLENGRDRVRPEILAPAGSEGMMDAAIENGADAVFFGIEAFNARLRAHNFQLSDLPRVMARLHERGLKGYVTLNTLIFSGEMEEAARVLEACGRAGVDAILVQDLGLAALTHQLVPNLPVHASTQMTLTCAESVLAAEELGLSLERVVAPRENNLRELKSMVDGQPREVEVFVHGALCVAYSGQCLTSEALGGRSANRGECAQACRLPYDLVVDGRDHNTGDLRYLLSPKDLMAAGDIGHLVRMGISSLKIEGRLKTPEYVAATVQAYRAAVDRAMAGDQETSPTPEERERLEMTFSRGFTGGYVHETNHQKVVEGRFPKKRGLYLGRVTEVGRDGRVVVELVPDLLQKPRAGDGVVFDQGRPEQEEPGGRLHAVDPVDPRRPHFVRLFFGRDWTQRRRIKVGDRLWKTSDPALERRLSESFSGSKIHHRRAVDVHGTRNALGGLSLIWTDRETGLSVEVSDSLPLEQARQSGLTLAVARQHLEKLAATPFVLGELSLEPELSQWAIAPSRLNGLRRQAVEQLIQQRREFPLEGREVVDSEALSRWRQTIMNRPRQAPAAPALSLLCRTLEQVEAVATHPALNRIYVDLEDPRQLKEARKMIPETGDGPQFAPATLRIHKPGERGFLKLVLESQPDALLIRHLAGWREAQEICPQVPRIADHTLNIANDLTADLLRSRGQFTLLTPSYDLNMDQLSHLLQRFDPGSFEVTIHQHMPMFHMEHCVFCRFLSTGKDYRDCGRPCEKHEVRLRDRVGYEHPVKADAGCRNTVYNAVAQSASAYLPQMLERGVRHFRADLVNETAEQTLELVELYGEALNGKRDPLELWKSLKAVSKLGVTKGTLDHA